MIKAYVLIQADPGKAGRVVDAVMGVKGVISADGVTGPYDVVALAEARSLDELSLKAISAVNSCRKGAFPYPHLVTPAPRPS